MGLQGDHKREIGERGEMKADQASSNGETAAAAGQQPAADDGSRRPEKDNRT